MKIRLLFIVPVILLCTSSANAQIEDVVSETKDAFGNYQSAHKRIVSALDLINSCDYTEEVDEIKGYLSDAITDVSAAESYARQAEYSANSAMLEAQGIECEYAESEALNAEDYFRSAKSEISDAEDELSDAEYEDELDEIKYYLSEAQSELEAALRKLSYGADDLNDILSALEDCTVNVKNYDTSQVSCEDLFEFIIDNGSEKGSLSSYLMESEWLSKVTAYSYDYKIYIIAAIKESEYSYSTSNYIFCGIPESNWQSFKNGGYYDSDSYGERFHKYIIDYTCDCN